MIEFIRKRWVLFLILMVFILLKIPHLHYAFYWDECTPYAEAIKSLYRHGVSLSPGALSPELSRGHPLLFHAAAVTWMNIFGTAHFSLHSFALFISVLLLIAIYEVGLRLFNTRVALLSTVLLALQVLFFVQSSFVLPEVLVALLAFISLYFYAQEKFIPAAICLAALFYTKESGLVLGVVLGADAFISLFRTQQLWKMRIGRITSVSVPILLFGIFFLYQKHLRGWFLYPMHNNYIERKWDSFWYCFNVNCLKGVFIWEYRYYYFILVLALSLFAAVKNKNYRHLFLFFPAIIIYFCTDGETVHILSGVPFLIAFIFSIGIMLYNMAKLNFFKNGVQQKFIVLCCAFIFCYFWFSAMNFFTPRYLIAAVAPLLFFAAVVIDRLIALTSKFLFYPVLLVILLIGFFSFYLDKGAGDCNLGAFDGLEVQQKVVDYIEQNNFYDRVICCGEYLEGQHLINPATGFLHSDKFCKNVSMDINEKTEIAIFDNIENDTRVKMVRNDPSFHLIYRFQKGALWAEMKFQ